MGHRRGAGRRGAGAGDVRGGRPGRACDPSARLSSNGRSCASCHAEYGAFGPAFARPYPHEVDASSSAFGHSPVYLDETIQSCMIGPMAAKPLPWASSTLADLTAYVTQYQKGFVPPR